MCNVLLFVLTVHYYNQVIVDTFVIMFQQELQDGEDVARCPSCSLIIRVIYDLASQHFVVLECIIICIMEILSFCPFIVVARF